MEIHLSAGARVKALGIVNNWPANSRGMIKMLDRVAEVLELSEADKTACGWREIHTDGQRFYAYQGQTPTICEIDDADAQMLRRMIEPGEHATYTRAEKTILTELESALGELA